MSESILIGLANNVGLLLALGLIYDVTVLKKESKGSTAYQLLLGGILGSIGILVMLIPLKFVPGVTFDTRSVLLCISGLFFGTIPTLVAMLFTSALRAYQGGIGAITGVIVILTSGFIGILCRHLPRLKLEKMRFIDLYVFGVVVHANMLLWMLTLPWEVTFKVWTDTGLAIIILYPLATAFLGYLMVERLASKKAQTRLKESEANFRTYISKAPYGVFVSDDSGYLVDVNEMACTLTQYPREELIGMHFTMLIIPEEHLRSKKEFETMMDRGEISTDFTVRRKNGTTGTFSLLAIKLNDKLALGFGNDTTETRKAQEELKKSEERFRTIVETSQEGIWTLDPNFRILFANSKLAEMLEYSLSEMIGQKSRVFIDEEDLRLFDQRTQLRSAGKSEIYEIRLKRKNGLPLWCMVSATALQEVDGSFLGAFAMITPIDVRKRMEVDLKESNRKLKQAIEEANLLAEEARKANEVKSRFLAHMSHEIRTPMHGVMGALRMLAETSLSSDQKDYLGIAESSSKILLSIIDDILDFSKIEAGKLELENIPFDFSLLFDEIQKMYTLKAQEKENKLLASLDPKIPTILKGDPKRLKQVLVNFTENAVKFTNKGEIHLTVSLLKENAERVDILCEVKDSGCGIPKEKINTLFTPFTQVDSSITRKFGGTGLGLSIAKELVSLMDGEIGVESEEGRGSRFWVVLSFEKTTEKVKNNPVSLPKTTSKIEFIRSKSEKPCILVAEDNAINQLLLKKMILKLGMEVVLSFNGEEVLVQLKKKKFDLILMDCQMPTLDGWKTTEIIRSGKEEGIDKEIPIIAMTAYAMAGDRERCLTAGMNDYLSKPVDIDEFREKVIRWLHV